MGRVNHEAVYTVLVWMVWVITLGLGAYNVYIQFRGHTTAKDVITSAVVNKLLAIYIAVFGLIGVIFEAGVGPVKRALKFLRSKSGHGVFFLFVGSLSLAFVDDTRDASARDVWDYVLVPAIMGFFSCGVGIYCFVAICFGSKDKDSEAGAEGDYVSPDEAKRMV
jgi:hypothetical protein